jgi:hypothetical protein
MVISLTSLPREVFYLPCDRNSERCLVMRADDPENKEVVLFVSELNQDVDAAVTRQIDTAVVTDRMGLASLAHAILEIAMGLYPADEREGGAVPEMNGDGP